MQAPPTLLSLVGKSATVGFLVTSEVVSGSWCIHCEICFSHLMVLCCLLFLNRPLQTASERHGFLPSSPCSSRTLELGASLAVCLYWCMVAFRLVFVSIADRLGLLLSDRRGIT